ncbi:hypothetical protein ACFL6S_11405 [Candidatus Poribacteria bacterium]
MRHLSVFFVLSVLLLTTFSVYSGMAFDEDVREEVVGLFGTLQAPSIFTTAKSEQFSISLYGRSLNAEGEVPDFDGTFEDEIDELTIFASVRLNGLGLTAGFGEGSEFEFSQPVIVSLDYKAGLLENNPSADAAIDFQYSIIVLPDEEKIEVSALGFGVISINGLISANLLSIAEPYAGFTLNYVYLNSDTEGSIKAWKPVPKVGLRVGFGAVAISTELSLINNKHIDSAWMWNLGATVRF